MRVASIDIGTNTLRLLILEAKLADRNERLYIGREITRLGEGFSDEFKIINKNAIDRSVSVLSNFAKIIEKHNVDQVRAVATSAVRESLNGTEFVERIIRDTGLPVEIITGEEEARLTVAGVMNSVTFSTPDCLIFDIGGGSTEYVYVSEGTIKNVNSINLGVVSLTEQYLKNEIDTESDLLQLDNRIKLVLEEGLSDFLSPAENTGNLTIIGTAGTPTTLAAIEMRLDPYDPALVNNFNLTRHMITEILNSLAELPKPERIKIPGLEAGREDLIIPGIMITLETLERFSCDSMLVSDAGLLEGVAYNLIN
ncbi:MAG: Ppx/GppA phosphatase family protein [Deltaproteobacteria bacterium]